jgi:hypothetical protein
MNKSVALEICLKLVIYKFLTIIYSKNLNFSRELSLNHSMEQLKNT